MLPSVAELQERLNQLREEVGQFSGGRPARIIAVTKTFPDDLWQTCLSAGLRNLGENKVQEGLRKRELLRESGTEPADLELHHIGPLQSNKARYLPGNYEWAHGLASRGALKELNKRVAKVGGHLKILLQANISGEESKHGFSPAEIRQIATEIEEGAWPALDFRGLMTMGIFGAGEEANRKVFAACRELLEDCRRKLGNSDQPERAQDFQELSMGMSGDYGWALAEGATMIRVGTKLFGPRDYP